MVLDIPFYTSTNKDNCGPLVLKMVLSYFGEEYSLNELSKLEKQLDSGLVWSIGIARAAKKLGFNVRFITISDSTNENEGIEYYTKYSNDRGKVILKELKDEVRMMNIKLEQKNISINELLSYISKDSIPIVLINYNTLLKKEKFVGHFVPLLGHDNNSIYIHFTNVKPYMKIEKKIFLEAWESKGTDKDTVIIYRKK